MCIRDSSSAPQIRYPDYYGIDMARLEEFCVFRAAIQLLKERKMEDLIAVSYTHLANHITAIKVLHRGLEYIAHLHVVFYIAVSYTHLTRSMKLSISSIEVRALHSGWLMPLLVNI